MKKAIIIGASSGIGKALAIELSENGFELGILARRENLLNELQKELKAPSIAKYIDLTEPEEAIKILSNLIQEMQNVDLIIINAGIGPINNDLVWQIEKETIETNVIGFASMSNVAFKYFLKIGKGHLVGISSIASIKGSANAPSYNASKSFISQYMQGLRLKLLNLKIDQIKITDIKPGYVETAILKGRKPFWCTTPKKAAEQILEAIIKKKKIAYVPKRWFFLAILFRILPEYFYKVFRKFISKNLLNT